MTNPSTPASSLTTKLEQAEEVLSILRGLLRDTPLWEGLKINYFEGYAEAELFQEDALRGEVPDEAGRCLLRCFWDQVGGPPNSIKSVPESSDEFPLWICFRTFDRLAFSRYLPQIANALDQRHIGLVEDRYWTHDLDTPRTSIRRADEGPTVRMWNRLTIKLDTASTFQADAWLKTALREICVSPDPRANAHMPDYHADKLGYLVPVSYKYFRTGVALTYPTMAVAQRAVSALFSDCNPKFSRKGLSTKKVKVTLTFPPA